MTREPLTVSIIVPTMNRPDDLNRCLASIAAQDRRPEQVVVVDDGESDERALRRPLDGTDIELVYVRKDPSQRGLCKSRNAGILASRGSIIIFLDDDIELQQGFVRAYLDEFEADAAGEIGGLSGRISRFKNGQILPEGHPEVGWDVALARFFLVAPRKGGHVLPSGFRKSLPWPKERTAVSILPGGDMALRREVFHDFRFDEELDRLSGYALGEDAMFSYPVSRRYRLFAIPTSHCLHHNASGGRPDRYRFNRMRVIHTWKFVREVMDPGWPNYAAFAWACLGLIVIHAVGLAGARSARAWDAFRGVISGIAHVASHPTEFPRSPSRPGLLPRVPR